MTYLRSPGGDRLAARQAGNRVPLPARPLRPPRTPRASSRAKPSTTRHSFPTAAGRG